ncbi:MAG: histidine kinase, partial [Bacteroidota bacterium]
MRTLFTKRYGELVFQVLVTSILFLFYWYGQGLLSYASEGIAFTAIPYQVSFFANYALAAMFINYILLPRFYAKKRFAIFGMFTILLILIVILIDEFVLEQIYFPTTRGAYFPGVLFSLLETMPLILVFVGCKFAWDYNRKQSEIENLKSLVQESELQFLKSQINPHFLFNNLNNLYALTSENSSKAQKVILELSSVLRYMLYDCKEKFTPLEKEITNLKHYTALNELQIGERGKIHFEAKTALPDFAIAPLILIVFVENAFKHSTASQSENIKIDISVNVDAKGYLVFSCTNSFLPETNTHNLAKGIGLTNVKKRLELLYPNSHELRIVQNE